MLGGLDIALPINKTGTVSSLHLFPVRFADTVLRKKIYLKLIGIGYGVNVHYIPIYRHPFHSVGESERHQFANSERHYETTLSLPLFPSIMKAQQEEIVSAIREVLD